MTATETLKDTIEKEIAAHKILIYSKGTKEAPRCGFTVETMEFFNRYGHPYEMIDVLENPEKRQALTEMTNWPTLPKVFINGKFYGDTDILDEMVQKGEMDVVFKEAFGENN